MFEPIVFTSHAMVKLQVLRRHGFKIEKEMVVDAIRHPSKVIRGRKDRFIAQRVYNQRHLIRVVYEVRDSKVMVVTLYPVKRERYEG